ncbi:MAG TPA: DUF6691 family protein [Burkholderiales bacterium]|nr:DUF6691 family protein [Burkholderiales bacterium]
MADPRKVLDFLDVAGNWDPSLLLVMGGAVAVTAVAFRPLFGIGWGIGGYCPGPALTALANLSGEVFIFVSAMIAGGVFAKIVLPAGSGA